MADESQGHRRFTGLTRRKTKPSVKVYDHLARWVIAIGGVGTIVAVLGVCVFLVSVAFWLFSSARLDGAKKLAATAKEKEPPLKFGVDEFLLLGWNLSPAGKLQGFKLADGKPLGEPQIIRAEDDETSAALSCCAAAVDRQCKDFDFANGNASVFAFGFEDGSVRLGAIGYDTSFFDSQDPQLTDEIRKLKDGDAPVEFQGGLIQRIPNGQLRLQKLAVKLKPRTPPVAESPIKQLDFSLRSEGPIFVARSANGAVTVNAVRIVRNLLTDEDTVKVRSAQLPLPDGVTGEPQKALISGLGDNVFLCWKDGTMVRYGTLDLNAPAQIEKIALLEKGVELTDAQFLLGKSTIIVADSKGRLAAWFSTKPDNAATSDGVVFAKGHELPGTDAPITTLACSPRSRTVAAGDAQGHVLLAYVTSERRLAEVQIDGKDAIASLLVAPKEDAILAASPSGAQIWSFDPAYPEVTLATLTLPIWYEGFSQPQQSWQTTGSTDDFEPKFGLWPLVFGTLKATFYSLLFGVPLALMAAIFTSEFMHPAVRAQVKPLIETMASLPSVVLGFLAGLVIAPMMETIVPAALASFATVPLAFLLGSFLWQLLPIDVAIQYRRWRFACMLILLPIGLLAAYWLGPTVERLMFDGNLQRWLAHQAGTGTPGWTIILLPLAAVAATYTSTRLVHPWMRDISMGWTRTQAATMDLGKIVLGILLTIAIAALAGWLLNALGLDPRGSQRASNWALVGTYVQRNALVVGFMMGFAIVPIIYTLADDALNTVPAHLRSASLAAGATPWQTLVRVVVPTAMSGLFSAVMIGLGRAVGETMIVLMAGGNTPLMEMNIFNGFRTLSASIAVEMPEAARNTTHFRVLFLAGLVLFVMTFVVNTAAEAIRQRFRRRAYEL